MNPVEQALSLGYDDEQVLNFVAQKYPEITEKISKAIHSGYTPKSILKFITPFFSQFQPQKPIRAASQQGAHAERRKQDIEGNKKLIKDAASLVSTLGTGYAAGKVIQNVAPKMGELLRKVGMGTQASQIASAPVAEALGEVEKNLSLSSLKSLKTDLEDLKLTSKIEKLVANNTNLEVLGGIFNKMIPEEKKIEIEKKYGKNFGKLLKDYAISFLEKAEKSPFSKESLIHQRNIAESQNNNTNEPDSSLAENVSNFDENAQLKNERTKANEAEKISSRLVELPDGNVGHLIDERQGIGSVQMPDGTIRRRKMEEMVQEPQELEEQITQLIEAIPEEERSAVLAFASYDPGKEFMFEGKKHNIPFMGVQFHNGDFYLYPGVNKDQYDKVVSKAVKAKTTGANPWHAWTAGAGSRGAGMTELIRELEKEFGKNFIKLKASEGYDYFKRIREIVKKIEREKRRNFS